MARVNNDTITQLKEIPIREVAERLGLEVKTRGNSRCFNTNAHAHGDRNPSLSFNARTNTFKCFTCEVGGDTIALVQDVNKVGFREACEWLANSFGVTIQGERPSKKPLNEPDFERKSPYTDHNEPIRFNSLLEYKTPHQKIYQALYDLSDEPNKALKEWWAKRGFSNSLLKAYGWRSITPATIRKLLKEYDYPLLAKSGLVSDDKAELEQFLKRYNSHNVIVPFYDDSLFGGRKVLYVRFRALDPKQKAKYLAPKGTSPVIYGYDRLMLWATSYPKVPPLYITESETDSIAVTELAKRQGKDVYAIALVGGQKTEHSLVVRELINLLKNVDKGATINLVTDRDKTGEVFYNSLATSLYKAGFNPDNLIKWQAWHKSLKDVGEHLQKLAEQPTDQHPVNNKLKREVKK